jgi:hypothetical protein
MIHRQKGEWISKQVLVLYNHFLNFSFLFQKNKEPNLLAVHLNILTDPSLRPIQTQAQTV